MTVQRKREFTTLASPTLNDIDATIARREQQKELLDPGPDNEWKRGAKYVPLHERLAAKGRARQ